MSDLIPTNTLRGIYAPQKPTAPPTESRELDNIDGRSLQTGPLSTDPGQHTSSDFVLGRSAIISIIAVSIILIVLIIVVVVKAGQIAKKNAREKKAKQEADKAKGIVSAAVRGYMGGEGLVAVLGVVLAQVVLL